MREANDGGWKGEEQGREKRFRVMSTILLLPLLEEEEEEEEEHISFKSFLPACLLAFIFRFIASLQKKNP